LAPRNPKPRKQTRPRKLKPRRRGQSDTAPTKAKSYTIPFSVRLEIRKMAPEYGSQGRAIQVGSELLLRMINLPAAELPEALNQMVRTTYKLPPRTIKVIDELAHTEYDSAGEVITASMKTLKMKKIGPQR